MRPARLPRRSRPTSRPARLQYPSIDEASLFNPFHAASRRFNVGKRAGGTAGVKANLDAYARALLRLDIRSSRNVCERRHIIADQLVESLRRGRLRLQADRDPALFRVGVGEDPHYLTIEFRHDRSRDGG